MPLISYSCSCGEITKKYLKSAKEAATSIACKCGLEAKKAFGNTSSSYKITVDNGLMARKIEIDPDIMSINDERSNRDYANEDD